MNKFARIGISRLAKQQYLYPRIVAVLIAASLERHGFVCGVRARVDSGEAARRRGAREGEGGYKGRRRALTPDQVKLLLQRVAAGAKKAVMARELGVSRETVHR
jgi:Helix-turn-helix domain of resolvase